MKKENAMEGKKKIEKNLRSKSRDAKGDRSVNGGSMRWRKRISGTGFILLFFAVVFIIMATLEKNLNKRIEEIKFLCEKATQQLMEVLGVFNEGVYL